MTGDDHLRINPSRSADKHCLKTDRATLKNILKIMFDRVGRDKYNPSHASQKWLRNEASKGLKKQIKLSLFLQVLGWQANKLMFICGINQKIDWLIYSVECDLSRAEVCLKLRGSCTSWIGKKRYAGSSVCYCIGCINKKRLFVTLNSEALRRGWFWVKCVSSMTHSDHLLILRTCTEFERRDH